MKRVLRKITLAHLVAVVAVALVLGSGTAYAAKQVTSKTIKNNTIKSVDVKDAALTGTDVADGSLTSADILDGTITTADVATDTLTAADLAANSVASSEIADNAVTSSEIADNGVTSSEIADNAVTTTEILNGTVASTDVTDETLTAADLGTDSVNATEVADNSIDAGEIVDFGLTNEDVSVLAAQVNADGTIANACCTGVTGTHIGTGTYAVHFNVNISNCTFTATQGEAGVGGAAGGIMGVTDRSGDPNAVFVTARTDAGAVADKAFQLVVVC